MCSMKICMLNFKCTVENFKLLIQNKKKYIKSDIFIKTIKIRGNT